MSCKFKLGLRVLTIMLNQDSRQSLGEMATVIPVTGSFIEFAERFVDESLAFALGWAYWYLWVTVCTHLARR